MECEPKSGHVCVQPQSLFALVLVPATKPVCGASACHETGLYLQAQRVDAMQPTLALATQGALQGEARQARLVPYGKGAPWWPLFLSFLQGRLLVHKRLFS